MFLKRLKLFRKLRVAKLVAIKVYYTDTHAVFHFTCAKVMQQRPPRIVLIEIFGNPLRKQDMTTIAAIHHALCDIDPGAGDIGPLRHINKSADGTAVYAHPQV